MLWYDIHIKIRNFMYFICLEQKTGSNVVKTVGLTSKGSTRKRKHSSSDDEDSRATNLHSIVKVKDRK